ncbi:MAG: helix-turn-helix domain-containing protein [Nitrososphaerota archaeon]
MSERDVESQLKGKTAQVYMLLIKNAGTPMGVREVQRTLGLSSPSIAHHHLEKLVNMGLVRKTTRGEYEVAEVVKVGVLKSFVRIGRLLVPRYAFYSVLLSTMLIIYVLLYPQNFSSHNVVALIFGSVGCMILWYETFRVWKESGL